jgi:YgiT-type zinc finger domain-containing protein
MKRGTAPIHIDRNGCHITIDDVPAWVCEQCGEPLFEEKEVAAIQDLVQSLDEKCRVLKWSA